MKNWFIVWGDRCRGVSLKYAQGELLTPERVAISNRWSRISRVIYRIARLFGGDDSFYAYFQRAKNEL